MQTGSRLQGWCGPRSARTVGCAVASAALAACASSSSREVRSIAIDDFANPSPGIVTDVVEMSSGVLDGPEVMVSVKANEQLTVDIPSGKAKIDVERESGREVVAEKDAEGRTVVDEITPPVVVDAVTVGQVWPVDSLVGQINGRPIFADAFFEPMADQLTQAAAMPDRVVGREQFVRAVKSAFKQTVDSELIVAEAESQLTPEQQQGLFAWIRSIQEETIAERGGSIASAEASLEAERTQSLDEFLQWRRDLALAGRLLGQRIDPRAIVSWREVLQAYERDRKIYNPPQQIRIGRIRLDSAAEIEKVDRVKALVAEGRGFGDIARELGLQDGGLWQSSDLPATGIDGLPLSDAIKSRLKELPVDKISEPLQSREFTSWYAVIAVERPPAVSVYDRTLQLAITDQLRGIRKTIERERYIGSLRSRWVTDDIGEMEDRLIAFALERYWR